MMFLLFLILCVFVESAFSQTQIRRKTRESLVIQKNVSKHVQEREEAEKTAAEKAEETLSAAVVASRSRKFSQVLDLLDDYWVYSKDDQVQRQQYARLIESKSLFELGYEDSAEKILETLLDEVHLEGIRNEVEFDLAVIKARRKHYEDAIDGFYRVAGQMPNSSMGKKAFVYLRMCAHALDKNQLLAFFSRVSSLDIKIILLESLVRQVSNKEDVLRIQRLAFDLSKLKLQQTRFLNMLTDILKIAHKLHVEESMPKLKVGVLTEVTFDFFDGSLATNVGIQVLEGVLDVALHYNADHLKKQMVDIRLAKIFGPKNREAYLIGSQMLIEQDSVDFIFGPIYSDDAKAVGKYAHSKNVVMVTPTATDEMISELQNCFLVNPTFYYRGYATAEFILSDYKDNDSLLRFAIIADSSQSSMRMAKGFRERILEANHKIEWEVYLSENFTSLDEPVSRLDLKFDKLLGYDTTMFDAIYIPIADYKKGVIVLSQLDLYNITGLKVSLGDWVKDEALQKYHEIMNGLIYATDSYIRETKDVASVLNSYHAIWQEEPQKYYWVGYGAFSYLVDVIDISLVKNGKISIDNVFRRAKPYDALYTTIYFNDKNVNHWMNFLEFVDGELYYFE